MLQLLVQVCARILPKRTSPQTVVPNYCSDERFSKISIIQVCWSDCWHKCLKSVGAGVLSRLRFLLQQCAATSGAVVAAWVCCILGRAAATAAGAPGFELALVAVVADAVGSTIQQLMPSEEASLVHSSSVKKYQEQARAGPADVTSRSLHVPYGLIVDIVSYLALRMINLTD